MKTFYSLFLIFISLLFAQEKPNPPLFKIQIRLLQIDKDLHQLLPNSLLGNTKLQLFDISDLLFDINDLFQEEAEFSEADFYVWLQKEIPALVIDEKDTKYSCSLLKGTLILKQSESVLKEVEQLLTHIRHRQLEFAPSEDIVISEDIAIPEESLLFSSREQWAKNRKKIWEEILKKEGKPDRSRTFSKKLKVDFTRFMQTEKPSAISAPSVVIFENQKFEISIFRQVSYISDYEIKVAQNMTIADPIIGILNLGWAISGKIAFVSESQFHLSEVTARYCEAKEPFKKIQTGVNTGVGGILDVPEPITHEISLEQTFFPEEILIVGPIKPIYGDSLEPMWVVMEAEHSQEEEK